MKIEKNMLYQLIIIGAIVISILLWPVFWQLIMVFPIIFFVGLILLIIVRQRGHIEDERTIKISEKASEKAIIVFIFGSIMLLFISEFIIFFSFKEPGSSIKSFQWIFELIGSMFQSAFIISVIYVVFYAYYKYIYGGL